MNSSQTKELNHPKIVKTIFILDKDRRYSFDVNQNIKIHLLKRMIDAAANLNRAHLRIFHEGKEYTSYDESSLDVLFPDLNIIIFNLSVSFDSLEEYDDLISLKLNKEYCPIHFSKYPYFYCFTCGKSICFECVKSDEHKGHNYKEKYDYLQSGEKLVNEIFKNVKVKKPNLTEKYKIRYNNVLSML